MSNLIGQSLGRYHVLEQLGEGGMATMYKAYDTQLEREVAIKVIRKKAFPEEHLDRILKRFEREAKALAKLSHPNIVKIHEYGEHENLPYLIMEFLPGGTLKRRLSDAMPWQQAVQLLILIARALEYAHDHHVLHRDIKPANILLTEKGLPMLTDFGIAKMLELEETTALTGTGLGVGTPEYMAPEQGRGQGDHRADIYSLGVVMYEMTTGRKPFTANTPLAVLLMHTSDPLPLPRQLNPKLPVELERIIIKAQAKKPEDRYQSMGDFAKALEKLLWNKPIQGVPEAKGIESRRKRAEFKLPAIPRRTIMVVGIPALGIGLLAAFSSSLRALPAAIFPTPTPSNTSVPQFTATTSITAEPSNTPTPQFTPTVTSLPTEIVDAKGLSMRLVPAGEFTMGADETTNPLPPFTTDAGKFYEDTKPVHQIYLDAYYMDKYEVSNAFYKACVDSGTCAQPRKINYYNDLNYADHPVVYVNWFAAKTYCEWRGARLPTEAEWEKAARGIDGRTYPWGEEIDSSRANYGTGYSTEVGSYESGVSPYGIYDMAGNVLEWVSDWYSEPYYKNSPKSNPSGPSNGVGRVLRGGGYASNEISIIASNRASANPSSGPPYMVNTAGFRCAISASSVTGAGQAMDLESPTP